MAIKSIEAIPFAIKEPTERELARALGRDDAGCGLQQRNADAGIGGSGAHD